MESSPPKWYMKHIALPSSLQPSLKWGWEGRFDRDFG